MQQLQQNVGLFITDSKIISSTYIDTLNSRLATAINEGWVQFGAPFQFQDQLCVNVVKFDERITKLLNVAVTGVLAELGM
jgi:hypothetical protein